MQLTLPIKIQPTSEHEPVLWDLLMTKKPARKEGGSVPLLNGTMEILAVLHTYNKVTKPADIIFGTH